jgi:uncharacterized protein (DUF1800 family)
MTMADAALAAGRFGLGARQDTLQEIAGDPKSALRSELKQAAPGTLASAGLPTSAQAFREFREAAEKKKAEAADAKNNVEDIGRAIGQELRPLYTKEIFARTRAALDAGLGFRERLVQFWSNHFSVSMQQKLVVAPIAGAFEREAIRPHVTGSFFALLKAVEQHPGMLLYLDNAQSIGPNSLAGRISSRGLNENLAREILELHTLGVNGGYTQADVTSFAKIITGWSIVRPKRDPVHGGEFRFQAPFHEPGAQSVLGKRYAEGGIEQGEAVLADLARHPSTARFIATKLARHFIADEPPQASVDRIAQRFRASEGDLVSVYEALLDEPAAWAEPLAKLKRPGDFLISTLRGLGLSDLDNYKLVESFALLGERPFFAPSPAGYPDIADSWSGPEAIKTRLEFANTLSQRLGSAVDPAGRAQALLGPLLSTRTKEALTRAASGPQGLTLFLMSPEFQRR